MQAAKIDFGSSSATITATFGAGTTAGNFVVVAGGFDSATTGVTITNNSNPGDTVTVVDALFTNATIGMKSFVQAFYAPTAGSTAFKATYSGTNPTFGDLFIWEFSGLSSPIADKFPHATGLTATADSGSSGTLSSADEAAIGYGCTNTNFTAAGAGWSTVAGDGITATTSDLGEHRTVSATTAINATGTGGGNCTMHLATFMAGATNTIMFADQARS